MKKKSKKKNRGDLIVFTGHPFDANESMVGSTTPLQGLNEIIRTDDPKLVRVIKGTTGVVVDVYSHPGWHNQLRVLTDDGSLGWFWSDEVIKA